MAKCGSFCIFSEGFASSLLRCLVISVMSHFGNEIPDCCASCGSEPGDKNSLVKSGDIFTKISIIKQLEEKMLDSTFAASLDYKWTRGKI